MKRSRRTSAVSPGQRRQQRAGLWWLGGAVAVLAGLLLALAQGRELTATSVALLALGGAGVLVGSVLGISTLTFWSATRRRRARRRLRARAR